MKNFQEKVFEKEENLYLVNTFYVPGLVFHSIISSNLNLTSALVDE